MGNLRRPQSTSIYVLGDNALLNIFSFCRPILSGEDKMDATMERVWSGGWWYKIAHVCRRWRHLVLESSSYLDLYLVCTYNKPVGDMLAYSPPLPLIVDYGDEDRQVTIQDETGILVALQRRRRVRLIRLCLPPSSLRKLVATINGEFPILEYLGINPRNNDGQRLTLPETFKAPRLRHVVLGNIIDSPGMSHLPPPTPRFQSIETIGQCVRQCGTQLWRYALTCHVYQSARGTTHEQQITESIHPHS